MSTASKDCLTPLVLSRYTAGLLEDEELFTVQDHLLGCLDCEAAAARLREILDAQLLEQLAPEARPLSFLTSAAAEFGADRLQRWIRTGGELAARVSLGATGILYDLADFAAWARPDTAFAPALAHTGVSRGDQTAEEAPLTGPRLDLPTAGDALARLIVEPRQRRLTVYLQDVPAIAHPPLVAVRQADGTLEVKTAVAQEASSGDTNLRDYRAEFSCGETSNLLVIVEPFHAEE